MKSKIVSLICMVIALASCEHKELCYHHPHTTTIRVEFDWTNAPEASPEGMCVFFYSTEDGSVQRFDFSGTTGGEIDIAVGTYNVLCYNNDTEGVLFTGTDAFDTHAGYTREGSIFESIYGSANSSARVDDSGERVVICPDMMWGCSASTVNITESGISYVCIPVQDKDKVEVNNTEQVITLYPAELICTYTYEVLNVNNLSYATQMCGSIAGMAPSMIFSTEELGEECVTLPFESVSDGVSKITGKFYTFGNNESNSEPHKFILYFWISDGSKYYYTFDVSEQVDQAPDKRHVHIVIDNIDLPQPITNGSGFKPSVDEWQSQEEDIVM
ncbi:MAG: DUF5119 domain-containing protein [Prevotellaceae bacterium]|nr:DUF5119 domain-containing protein [Prevotellaceae bacterium]